MGGNVTLPAITDLLNQGGFLQTLFESAPCGIVVVDQDRRVQAVNNLLERTFGLPRAEIVDRRYGEALRCIHASESPGGCGHADFCRDCRVRNIALEALGGGRIHRTKTSVTLLVDDEERDLELLVSAAPIEYEGEPFAIVMLEDVTELNHLRSRLKTEDGFAGIVGRDKRMLALYETIRDVADAKAPVLIQGESGTGKELVAAAIHHEGVWSNKNFVPINCGALPEGLLESELFGHVRGAFTGAIRDKKGRFELADGGTIFLDEVADLSPAIQVKLLRVLQEGTFERVGGEKTIRVNTRVISATNKELRGEVAAGRFREDLFYRLCVVPIELPPLRERRGDIPLLAEHILKNAVGETGRDETVMSPEILDIMMDYDWPGNVREMQNALQYALIKCRGTVIEPEHLPPVMTRPRLAAKTSIKRDRTRKLDAESVRLALEETGGNKVKAAKLLGVGRATLYRFLDDHSALLSDD
jgi:transcriptional regulator with PAS, ATPase and Fis domain